METSALSFGQPWVLNFLWLLVPVAALFWWAERRRRALIGQIVAPKLRAVLAGNTSPFRRIFRGACVVAALALLVVALAEPRLGYDTLEVPHRGRDVVIAMDVSRSMMATDVAPTRLQRAKLLAEDLVSELGGDRIGLVAFAGSAFLQAPLTLDHGAVLSALDELDTDLIPKGGTNLAAAIRASGEAFTKAEGFSRAIIIISDGEELDADGLAAARDAAADGVRIFTVGVGSAEGSEIPLAPGEFVRDPAGKVVQSKLDAARMKEIAEATGGFYTPLDEQAARLLAAEGIGKMAESDIDTESSRRPIERYQWPLGAALVLLVLQALVGERRRVPLGAAAALWLAAAAPSQASGIAAYEQGNYEQARQDFENRLKMEPEAPNLQLNAGAAAYRLKDYGKASQYFSKAMLAEDPALRSAAEFNLGNTLFRQGEGQEDKEKKVSDWKDAIAQYEAALKTRPDYSEARENKERVEQLLEELEKEQKQDKKQDQKKDQQKQDQQQKDQQQGGNEKQDQQQQGGEQDQKQDQQQGDKDQQQQGGGKDEEKKDQQGGQEQKEPSGDGGKDQKDQQGQSKDEQKQDGQGGEQKQDQKGGGQDKEQQDGQQGEKDEKQQGGQGEQKPDQKGGGQPEDQQQKDAGEKPDEQKQEGQGGEQKQDQPGGQDEKKQDGQQGEKDEQQQGGQGQQPQDRGEGGEEKSEQGSPSGPGDGEQKQGAGKPGDAPAPAPTPSGPKKEGELRGTAGGSPDEAGEEGVGYSDAPNEDGSMSEGQARSLLRALQGEEEKVDLLERRAFQDVSRDW